MEGCLMATIYIEGYASCEIVLYGERLVLGIEPPNRMDLPLRTCIGR